MPQEGVAFGGGKETRVQWVGNDDKILATGVSKVKNDDISYEVFDWLVMEVNPKPLETF